MPPQLSAHRCCSSSVQDAGLPMLPVMSTVSVGFDFADIESHMQRADAEILQLQEHKRYLAESKNEHVCVHRVPPELLAVVFQQLLPEYTRDNSPKPPSTRDAPLLVSQICRRWRNIVLSLPELWSTIVIVEDSHFDDSSKIISRSIRQRQNIACMVDTWLHRSSEQALCIHLHVKFLSFNDMRPDLDPIRFASSHRWRYADLRKTTSLYQILLAKVRCLPLLEVLDIGHAEGTMVPLNIGTTFSDAPKLTDIALFGIQYVLPLSPWSQILNIDVCGDSMLGIDMLQQCTSLQTLRTHEHCTFSQYTIHREQLMGITLNSLRVLSTNTHVGMVLLHTADLPVLEELTLHHCDSSQRAFFLHATAHGTLVSFLTRSECRLRKLTLTNYYMHPRATEVKIRYFLGLLPAIEVLDITFNNRDYPRNPAGAIIKALTDTSLCTNLEQLILKSSTNVDGNRLADTLRSRCNVHLPASFTRRMSSVEIVGEGAVFLSAENGSYMQQLQQQGLDLRITMCWLTTTHDLP